MTMMRVLLSLFFVTGSSAFTTNVQRTTSLPLNVGVALDWNSQDEESFLMQWASECADSESCSLEDAKVCLDNVIRIQSGCSSGSLVGNSICEDVDVAAGIVANLREKIDSETKRLSLISAGSSVLNASLVLLFLSASVTGMTHLDPNVAPFTAQEWWWALRDGYLPAMLSEYFKYGGLATADYQPETTAFTLQEVWWAAQGGYLDTLFAHFFKNGGLAADDQLLASSVPFTPQEWMWSVQGGYLNEMMSQNFLNGGITDVASSDVDTYLPITAQEIVLAAKDGYLDTLTKAWLQNGGV